MTRHLYLPKTTHQYGANLAKNLCRHLYLPHYVT